jgi:hypothetical protein
VVSKTSENNRIPLKEVTVECPAGSRVLGGGGDIIPRSANATLVRLVPVHGGLIDKFVVRAYQLEGPTLSIDWKLTGYAVCGPALPGLVIAYTDDSDPPGQLESEVSVTCPDGKRPIGVGAEIFGGGQDRASFRMINPVAAAGRVTVIAQDDELNSLPPAPDFRVRAYAVCVNKRPVHVEATGDEVTGENAAVSTSITCPIAGTEVHAFGIIRDDAFGYSRLTGIVPSKTDRRKVTVYAARPDTSGPLTPPWTLDTAVVCAT